MKIVINSQYILVLRTLYHHKIAEQNAQELWQNITVLIVYNHYLLFSKVHNRRIHTRGFEAWTKTSY